jgi:hypothetical protein
MTGKRAFQWGVVASQRLGWTPEQLTPSELSYWYKADAGVAVVSGNKVASWEDQSSWGNHVAQSGGDSLQPSYVLSGMNGLPVLNFQSQRLVRATMVQGTISQPHMVFTVGTTPAVAGIGIEYTISSYNTAISRMDEYFIAGPRRGAAYAGNVSTSQSVLNSSPYVRRTNYAGAVGSVDFQLPNLPRIVGPASNVGTQGRNGITIGGYNNSTLQALVDSDICEVVGVNILAPYKVELMWSYLGLKWGIQP